MATFVDVPFNILCYNSQTTHYGLPYSANHNHRMATYVACRVRHFSFKNLFHVEKGILLQNIAYSLTHKVEGSVTAQISDVARNIRTILSGYFQRYGKQKDMRCKKDHIFWWSPKLVIIKRRSEPNCP